MSGGREHGGSPARAPISAVIPAYNREDLVGGALESILAQTLPVTEILVVDDGSTDATARVAEAHGARVVRQENRGVSAARNAGVRRASQPFIAFLDSDDLWEERKIELQWRALELCAEAEFVFTDMLQFHDGGVVTESFLSQRRNFGRVRRRPMENGIACCDRESLAANFLEGNFINPSTLLAPRELLIRSGLFDESFGHCEDRDLCLRLLALAGGAVVEQPLVRYRLHTSGASRDELKMALGSTIVAERVLAHPERYPSGAPAHYRATQPRDLYHAGVLSMEVGDLPQARRLLWSSLQRRPAPRTLAAWLVSMCGSPVYTVLRWTKQRLGLPGLR